MVTEAAAQTPQPAMRRILDAITAVRRPPAGELRGRMLAILADNPSLKTIYLLRPEIAAPAEPFSVRSLEMFLLWFAVFGRSDYQQAQRFTPDYLDFLWEEREPGAPRLLAYLMAGRQDVATRLPRWEERLGWLLAQGVLEYGLAPLLSTGFLRTLSAPAPGAGGRSQAEAAAAAFAAAVADAPAAARDEPPRLPFPPVQDSRLPKFLMPGPAPAGDGLPGVTIVGFHRGTLGIGEDARSLFKALRRAGIPAELIDVCPPNLEPIQEAESYEPFEVKAPSFPLVVICAPPFETARLAAEWGPGPFAGRRVVGAWPWELTRMQTEWAHVYALVDEIWASTRFLQEVFSRETRKPVLQMPMLVEAPEPAPVDLTDYGVAPRDMLFLAMFDFNSTIARKNPIGVIQAFRLAFPPGEGDVRLLIKTTHAGVRPQDWDAVVAAIGDDDRIVIVDGSLERRELCGLIAAADAFVSLHRSEGFGRILAEAMMLGTPVIATDWSGSRDYLDETTGYPVRCTQRPVTTAEYPHAAGMWADPDIHHAAELMRRLRDAPAAASARVAAARRKVEAQYGLDAVAGAVVARLEQIVAGS